MFARHLQTQPRSLSRQRPGSQQEKGAPLRHRGDAATSARQGSLERKGCRSGTDSQAPCHLCHPCVG